MNHSISSLVLLLLLIVLSSLVELAHARLGDETKSESSEAADDDTPDLTHDTMTMNNLPELQDVSIARANTSASASTTTSSSTPISDRELQQGARPFSNPNSRDELLSAFVDDNDNMVRVMVGFKNDQGRNSARGFSGGGGTGAGAQRWQEMKNLRVATMIIAKTSIPMLESNPNIEYVEEDGIIMPDAETTPVGITLSQGGRSTVIPTPSSTSSSAAAGGKGGACNDPNSFKVAIIDSGVQGNHPDVPCRNVNSADSNCVGASFGVDGQPWFAPGSRAWHGTHVFGTIGAIGDNGRGVTSMVPDSEASNTCYMFARVFDDEGNGQYVSVLFQGIDWAISQGAHVINMSLSGGSTYITGQATFNAAKAAGILSVAAAGNGGSSSSLRYPASYDHVISVAATDDSGRRAAFSQSNNKVDIAAPGVSIISTVVQGGYAASTGTSMATPHVTGAIAKVWSVCRSCSADQVEQCLLSSASGNGIRTNDRGYGMVRAEDTYTCLVNQVKCCAQEEAEATVGDVSQNPPIVDEDDPEPVDDTEPIPRVPDAEPACTRRKTGQLCLRDFHCCSGKCEGAFRATTCRA